MCILEYYEKIDIRLIAMKKLTGQFRYTSWDPMLNLSQIIALQACFYFSLTAVIAIIDTIIGSSRSLDQLFKYQELQVRDATGKLVIAGFVVNALFGSLEIWYIVERTKLCLDFSATTHFLHLLICWMYNGAFPVSLAWWLLNIACLSIMCVCAEFLCLRSELKAIPLKVTPKVDL